MQNTYFYCPPSRPKPSTINPWDLVGYTRISVLNFEIWTRPRWSGLISWILLLIQIFILDIFRFVNISVWYINWNLFLVFCCILGICKLLFVWFSFPPPFFYSSYFSSCFFQLFSGSPNFCLFLPIFTVSSTFLFVLLCYSLVFLFHDFFLMIFGELIHFQF